jgi:two-component system sensor histidine kinase CiaH
MKFTVAYTLLFLYVVLAITFWGYSLRRQNNIVYALELEKLALRIPDRNSEAYQKELARVKDVKHRRMRQFWGEETTFLFVILLSAGVVYYAYFRQARLSRLQKNFMLSVTHELKTPLAGIKLNMQTLEKRSLDPAMQEKLVRSSVEETNRLNDLCNNILIATQLEDNSKAIYSDEVNLVALAEDLAKEMRGRYPSLDLRTRFDLPEYTISGDATLWKVVLSNLAENARKYSPPGKPIEIALLREGSQTILRVSDQGNGIPDKEKSLIFDKFYRIGNENTRQSKGTGLGLFIVKKIVSLYKYDIAVKNNVPSGSIFEVKLS